MVDEKPKRVACLTMSRDEALFLPIWYRYYSRLFGAENLFIVDHNSQESPPAQILGTAVLNLFRLPFDRPSQGEDQRAFDRERFGLISSLIAGLLKYYDTVIFNDTDEVFVTDPAVYPDLKALVLARNDPILAGVGLEIFHDPAEERPFDPAGSVLAQRRNYVYRFHHSKPHIVSQAVQIGGHGSRRPFRLDPHLYLMHLKFLDRGETLRRQERLRTFFDAGRGGLMSRWRFDAGEMEHQLAKMAASPRREGFAHQACLRDWLGEPVEGGWTIGKPMPARRKVMQHLTQFLPPDEMQAAQAVRRVLPPRFAKIEV
jgi:hypothetical protein